MPNPLNVSKGRMRAAIFVLAISWAVLMLGQTNAAERVSIKANGDVEPASAPVSRVGHETYVFTADIIDAMVSVERSNVVIDGAGHVLAGSGAYLSTGLYLERVSNVTIRNLKVRNFYVGIYAYYCSNCTFAANSVFDHGWKGIQLIHSSDNTVTENAVTNSNDGVAILEHSCSNRVAANRIGTNAGCGIWLDGQSNANVIEANVVEGNSHGVRLVSSSDNEISENALSRNQVGIYLDSSPGNVIHHNNFLDNARQVYDRSWDAPWVPGSTNSWNLGYPLGGNFWSDYLSADIKRGADQAESGSDGIGDVPYVIDANNRDRYPLMAPIGEPASSELQIVFSVAFAWFVPARVRAHNLTCRTGHVTRQGDKDSITVRPLG